MHDYVKSQHAELVERIDQSGDFDDEIEAAMRKALDEFKANQAW